MLEHLISILGSYFGSGFYLVYLLPIFALAFIATIPVVIRSFFRR